MTDKITFQDLGLNDEILRALAESGYTHPTEIQEKAIPAVLMMKDVIGIAQTGTGKTASFTLPMVECLSGGVAKARMPRGLVLAPTRELAAQVAENLDKYSQYLNLSHALIVGGVQATDQVSKLERGVDVLIATPGRLLDLFERGNILLSDIKFLVIDEADRMLDMGFIPDIEKILTLLPAIRQTLLFSATMPKPVQKLAEKFMSNPKTVEVARQSSTAETVTQKLIMLDSSRQKRKALVDLAVSEKMDRDLAFVFCNRKRDIDGYAKALTDKGLAAAPLHGDMPQSARTKTLAAFKDGETRILVCSDVAGRGIDISNVGNVINMDLPMNAEDYVHRIGRTGRAGKSGKAFSFAVMPEDEKFLDAIETLINKTIPRDEPVQTPKKSKQKTDKQNKKTEHKNKQICDDLPSPVGFGNDVPAFMAIGRA